MALTTLANVRLMPGFTTQVPYSDAYLTPIIAGVDRAIKNWLKRDIELTSYTDYYSGNGREDLIIRQWPVGALMTTVAAGSNGAALPVATLNVASTTGWLSTGGKLCVQASNSTYATITYTGLSSTTFTGCSGGTGTLVTGYTVTNPVVYFDPNGAWGQYVSNLPTVQSSFGDQCLLPMGTSFAVERDNTDGKSYRGMLKRIGLGGPGGGYGGWGTFSPSYYGLGKLAASQHVGWPYGDGNLKVVYQAGYDSVPADLILAANMLVALVSRIMPVGQFMNSEGYESYSYSLASTAIGNSETIPELGSLLGYLVQYREPTYTTTN